MKIALISDIHANYFFLKELLDFVKEEKVEAIYCLGDLVGYYDQPNEVIELIREQSIYCIKGNHDKYLLGELTYDDDNREALYRTRSQKKILAEDNFNFLKNLSDELILKVNDKKIYMTHSFPGNCEKYLYQLNQLDRALSSKYDYYFYGHTHIPMISYYYGTCVVNPGSVGQPRDHTQKPSYAIIDFLEDRVELKKIQIDLAYYSAHLKKLDFDEKVISILERKNNAKN